MVNERQTAPAPGIHWPWLYLRAEWTLLSGMGVEVHDPRWLAVLPGAELVVGLDEVGACAALGHRTTVLIDLVPGTVTSLREMAAEAVGEGARKVRVRPRGVDRSTSSTRRSS